MFITRFCQGIRKLRHETISLLQVHALLFLAQKKGTSPQESGKMPFIPVYENAAECSPLWAESFAIEFLKPSAPLWNDQRESSPVWTERLWLLYVLRKAGVRLLL